MNKNKKKNVNKMLLGVVSGISLFSIYQPNTVYVHASAIEKEDVKSKKKTVKKISQKEYQMNVLLKQKQEEDRVEKAKSVLLTQPESTALTLEGLHEKKKEQIENYMPIEGCSLDEKVNKKSDINYIPPKPKPKPKPKVKKVVKTNTISKTKVSTLSTKKVKESSTSEKANVQDSKVGSIKIKKTPESKVTYKKGASIEMSVEERKWLEKLVESESANEPYEGKLGVANVIANRVLMKEFPNTVMEVIKANNGKFHQFSPWDDGSIYRRTASSDTKKAVEEVFDNGLRILPEDTAYFCTTEIAPNSWVGQTRPFLKTIGNHSFYLK